MPLRHRHGYAADLHRDFPAGDINQPRSSPPASSGYAPQSSPHPPGSSWRYLLRGFIPMVPRVHLPVSLAGPTPSSSTGASRRCWGCFPPSPASPGSGCPQLHRPAATGQRWWSLTSTRFAAPRGARCPSTRPGWGHRPSVRVSCGPGGWPERGVPRSVPLGAGSCTSWTPSTSSGPHRVHAPIPAPAAGPHTRGGSTVPGHHGVPVWRALSWVRRVLRRPRGTGWLLR
jgi:hypothetical protein